MSSYLDFIQRKIEQIDKEVKLDTKNHFLRARIKFLGEIGVYSRILRKNEGAESALNQSLELINAHGMNVSIWGVHSIRLSEVQMDQKNYLEAEASLMSVLEMANRHVSINELKHFCYFLLGRLFYHKQDYRNSAQYLQQSLQVRSQMKNLFLIENSKKAIRIVLEKQK